MANLTLLDWAKRKAPDGTVADVAELLSQTNRILDDAVFMEGNLETGHRVTIRTGLPTIYYRALNQGIPTSKSQTTQVDESCAIMEAWSECDVDLANLNGNVASFRRSESEAFLEAMNQKMASTLFYGNPATDPKEYLGLAPRYSSLSAPNATNVLSAGGADADQQTSVYLVCWGDKSVFCPFPKGSEAGLTQEDHGIVTSYDTGTTGERMRVYSERFQWKSGLVVRDWRYAVRICNIGTTDDDTNSISDLGGTMAATNTGNLLHLMIKAQNRVPSLANVKPCYYMNRTVFTGLQRIALEKSNSAVTIQTAMTQFGTQENMLTFQGIPCRLSDAILNTEAVVS